MKEFKFSFYRTLEALFPLILKYGLVGFFFFNYLQIDPDQKMWLIFFGVLLAYDILPTIAVFVQYLIVDWGKKISFDLTSRQLTFTEKDGKYPYRYDDLVKLEYNGSYAAGSFLFYCFGHFRYWKFTMADGKTHIATSLVIPDIKNMNQKYLQVEFQTRIRVICFIY